MVIIRSRRILIGEFCTNVCTIKITQMLCEEIQNISQKVEKILTRYFKINNTNAKTSITNVLNYS